MSSINMSTVVLGKYAMLKKYEHYLNSTEKTVLPQGVGKTAPLGGARRPGPSSFFAPYISRTHNFRLFVAYNVE